MESIKILTINTHKGFNWSKKRIILRDLREAIRKTRADLVFLQEVIGEHKLFESQFSADWPKTSHFEYLAEQVWPGVVYAKNAVYDEGHHGNAFLSRFPVESWHNHDVSVEGVEKRGLLYSQINVNGRSVHTVCVHLGLKEGQRQHQLKKLAALINSLPVDDPVVVAGDFNDWLVKANRLLKRESRLVEAFRVRRGRSARTFPALFPLLKLDRIYVREGSEFSIKKVPRKPWAKLSDHKPLMIELKL